MLTTALLLMIASADAPRSMRLIADEVPQVPAYTGWGHRELTAEYERLSDARPGLGLPISLMAGGGAVLTVCAYALSGLATSGFRGVNVPIGAVFGVLATTSVAAVVIGGIMVSRILPERRVYSAQMDEVSARLNDLNDAERPYTPRYVAPPAEPEIIGPPPVGPPPLPLPPMPQASLTFPLLMARF